MIRIVRRSREGAWIEMPSGKDTRAHCIVAPVRERGLKCSSAEKLSHKVRVAPVRERGLKLQDGTCLMAHCGRSREGAWIEILSIDGIHTGPLVAPVRERGLKYDISSDISARVKVAPVRERGLKYHINIR